LAGAAGTSIWQHARDDEPVLVTKDQDFHVIFGPPPKVIWIRLGNCPTSEVEQLLRHRTVEIARFLRDDDAGFLELA